MTERNLSGFANRESGAARRASGSEPTALQDEPNADTWRPVPGRVVVERVQPEIDGGRFPIKRTIGESVMVSADAFADGHDLLAGVLKYRGPRPHSRDAAAARRSPGGDGGPGRRADDDWQEVPLEPLGNDSWGASFTVMDLGTYEYTVEAWVDHFGTWLQGLIAKFEAAQDVSSELLEGAEMIQSAAARLRRDSDEPGSGAPGSDVHLTLLEIADILRSSAPQDARVAAARDPRLRALMQNHPDRSASTTYERTLPVTVDPVRALFSAWYEMFPRSFTPDPARSGTFREAEAWLPAIESMGFDVLYLPPIHPIGRTHRKGPNNSLTAAPGDFGSPWAIGAEQGGHTAVEPGLGTLDDFDRFVARRQPPRAGSGARHRVPGLARSSLGARTSRVVQAPSRRHHQARGEPAEEVPGHLPVRFRDAGMAFPLECAA